MSEFPYKEKARRIMRQLEVCSNELHGMGLLGSVSPADSERLSGAGQDIDSVIEDLEKMIDGETDE